MTHTDLDARIDTLVAAFDSATYLGDGLPERPQAHKGIFRQSYPRFGIYVSRSGLDIDAADYGIAGEPVVVTMRCNVAAVVSYPAEADDMELLVNRLAANVLRVLFANTQVAGVAGWRDGIVTGSDATTYRSPDNVTFEIEVFEFAMRFELDRS